MKSFPPPPPVHHFSLRLPDGRLSRTPTSRRYLFPRMREAFASWSRAAGPFLEAIGVGPFFDGAFSFPRTTLGPRFFGPVAMARGSVSSQLHRDPVSSQTKLLRLPFFFFSEPPETCAGLSLPPSYTTSWTGKLSLLGSIVFLG